MPRASSGVPRHHRKIRVMARAKGYRGGRSKLWRTAKEAVARAGRFGFFGRKNKKRDYRGLWIIRINAALTGKGINYSRFMYGLKKAHVDLNRKSLSELAYHDEKAFGELVAVAKQHQ